MSTRIKPVRINTPNLPKLGNGPKYSNDDEFVWDNVVGDMQYLDYKRILKQGDIEIENLRTYTTPASAFTISAGTELKEGQIYLLRVNQGSTAYPITLGTNVSNPNGLGTITTENKMNVLQFIATSPIQLEYQGVITSYLDTTSTQSIDGLKTFNILPQSNAIPTNKKDLTTKGYVDTRTVATDDEGSATDNTVLYIITQ